MTVDIYFRFPMRALIALVFLALLEVKRIGSNGLISWFFFICFCILSGRHGVITAGYYDVMAIIGGAAFCLCMQTVEIDKEIIFKALFGCGFFVTITVLLDATTHIFQTSLLGIYTTASRRVVLGRAGTMVTGGIIPFAGSAGSFICAGLGAYIISLREKRLTVNNVAVLACFSTAFLLLQKRAFVLDIAAAFFVIWLCGFRRENVLRIDAEVLVRIVFAMIAIIASSILLYFLVPLFRHSYHSLVARFTTQDKTYSGRTILYALAYSLFKKHPFRGIGWGVFRMYSRNTLGDSKQTFEVHNVYLQLLCEAGIAGLGSFLLATGAALVKTLRKYRELIVEGIRNDEFYSLRLSIFLQVFFLAYCLSGNPLYDYNFLITYFVGLLLSF
ncbi:MAG: O-antigen ligase family protein [Blautia sp.]|nr:O-antigen ligase family protein [Blautia sp.]